MLNATLERNFWIEAPNKPGVGQKLSNLLSDQAKDNFQLLYGSSWNDQSQFIVIPDQFAKVEAVLKSSEFNKFREDQALVIRTKNKSGTVAEITKRLSDNGFDIKFICTSLFDGEPAVVLSTNDNAKALALFA